MAGEFSCKTAVPSKWIRNEQDRPKQVRYSIQHQEEQVTCSNVQSLRRLCLLCLVADSLRSPRRRYRNQGACAVYQPVPTCYRQAGLSSPTWSMRLRTNAIPGSMARLGRRRPCRDTIAAPPLRTRDRPLTWLLRARVDHGANRRLAWE